MTLPLRHRIWNTRPGGLRPSTQPLNVFKRHISHKTRFKKSWCIPARTRHWKNVGLMLSHCLRCWSNIEPTFAQLFSAGCGDTTCVGPVVARGWIRVGTGIGLPFLWDIQCRASQKTRNIHSKSAQCRPASETLAQHWTNLGWASRICWTLQRPHRQNPGGWSGYGTWTLSGRLHVIGTWARGEGGGGEMKRGSPWKKTLIYGASQRVHYRGWGMKVEGIRKYNTIIPCLAKVEYLFTFQVSRYCSWHCTGEIYIHVLAQVVTKDDAWRQHFCQYDKVFFSIIAM